MEKMQLGDRIKLQEKKFQHKFSNEEHVVIRLDGDSFSKFTKSFRKPFDSILVETMLRTTEALFTKFSASFSYTQSDEITLVIPSNKQEHVLAGKLQKLCSIAAGFASTCFNKFLLEEIEKDISISLELRSYLISSKVGFAWFDARVFSFDSKEEVFNTVLWRSRDAERNSISMLASTVFSHSELEFKNSSEKKDMLSSSGFSWDNLDSGLKYGFCIKKSLFYKDTNILRSKLVRLSDKLFFSEENVDLIFRKYL